MAKKNKDDKETSGIRHILSHLIELAESDDIDDMVECFNNLITNNQKYEYIEHTVNFDNKEFSRMNRIVKKVVKESEDKNG